MSSQDEVNAKLQELAIYRGNLAHLLRQAAQYGGELYAPLSNRNNIQDSRENIHHLKEILRDWNVEADDHPDDREPTPIKALSEALYGSANQAYTASGFGLSFLISGALLMVTAFLWPTKRMISYTMMFIGSALIFFTCIIFYLRNVKPLLNIRNNIQQNKELIDTVQKSALEMTELASNLQSLAFKHADQAANFIKIVRPQIRILPVVGKLADSDIFNKTDILSSSIVNYTIRAKQIISDIEQALITSNPENLKKYLLELKILRTDMQNFLRKGELSS
jgi:hypothetical protein